LNRDRKSITAGEQEAVLENELEKWILTTVQICEIDEFRSEILEYHGEITKFLDEICEFHGEIGEFYDEIGEFRDEIG
jgi:uncharacterized coiled-coil DUF342 family protein